MNPLLTLLVVLLAVVAFGNGGYAPWAILVLEAGAALGLVWLAGAASWRSDDARMRRHRAWRRMPFHLRHPLLGRLLNPSRMKTPRADVEILLPGEGPAEAVELDVGRNFYLWGIALKRTGLGAPVVLLSVWVLLSIVPMKVSQLELVSPEAHRWWSQAAVLAETGSETTAPWSLAPFLTLRSFWLWSAAVAIFLISVHCSRRDDGVARMSVLLLIVGAGSGVVGMVEWLTGLQSLFGANPLAVRASGTFGNANHYAAFQAMLLPISIGWLSYFRLRQPNRRHPRGTRHTSGSGPPRRNASAGSRPSQTKAGLGWIAALGVLLLALGLLMSLSRSGLAFALAGCAAWALLTREAGDRRALWAVGLLVAGFAFWIGIEPLFGRFANLEDEWALERGRTAVWRDVTPAVVDYWMTGSGLSSFRYVGGAYRSFGGEIFYSWAHNDYLQLAIELGVPGLLLFLWMVRALVRGARRVREDLDSDTALVHLHAGYVAAVIAVALHSLTDFSLHIPANLALLAIVAGVVVGIEPVPGGADAARRGFNEG